MDPNGFSASPRVIKKDHVHMQPPGAAQASASGQALPAVKLREEGGVVKAIEVQCACGGRIVIDCEYGTGGAPAAPKS